LVHLEAITSWSAKRTSRLALYRFLLGQKYKLPVASYVVLMAEKYAPKKMRARVVYQEEDGFRIVAPYRVIRLWEIDPQLAFEPGGEPLLPWVPLLRAGAAEFEKAVDEMGRLADHPGEAPYPVPVMVTNLATLAGLRYDKDVICHFLERLRTKMMLDTELFKDTWLYKDGVKAGRKQGKAEGQLEGKREMLRKTLRAKFPAVRELPEIDQVVTAGVFDDLLLAIFNAKGEDDVRAAIQAAIRVN
jgi:hypothetical protein